MSLYIGESGVHEHLLKSSDVSIELSVLLTRPLAMVLKRLRLLHGITRAEAA